MFKPKACARRIAFKVRISLAKAPIMSLRAPGAGHRLKANQPA